MPFSCSHTRNIPRSGDAVKGTQPPTLRASRAQTARVPCAWCPPPHLPGDPGRHVRAAGDAATWSPDPSRERRLLTTVPITA